ncbi:cupin domain-containing protein [Telluribacter humicola]|uniref:cupin domain-containing protein n=1 Tax=Telluribacter humicola TaxID=1720261 RepID=UPI001A974C8B|nr:cupin domain-containing protein [Telluribacter humicola]
METFVKAPAVVNPSVPQKSTLSATVSLLFYPTGVYRIWTKRYPLWARLLYTLLGLPLFLLGSIYVGIVVFALFLPELDMSIGDRKDRTVINKVGNYATTFLKTGRETGGAYELIRVELEPQGGNGWHYHKTFDEQFTVAEGTITIGLEGKELLLSKGQTATAPKTKMHFFKNPSSTKTILIVKTIPARGLEKTIRIGYGLSNSGQIDANGIPSNPWHMALLLGYSESYFPVVPPMIQEPFIKGMAKIAQWRGEDKVLEQYFR